MKKPKNSLTRQQMKLGRRAKRMYALAAGLLLSVALLLNLLAIFLPHDGKGRP